MAVECPAPPAPIPLAQQALSVLRSTGLAELVCAKPAVLLHGAPDPAEVHGLAMTLSEFFAVDRKPL